MTDKLKTLLEAPAVLPAVSIILPVGHMRRWPKVSQRLLAIPEQLQPYLQLEYSNEIAMTLTSRLSALSSEIEFEQGGQGLALFVNPDFQNLFWLEHQVAEQIYVGATFSIREMIKDERTKPEYFVLILSATHSRLLQGVGYQLCELPNILSTSMDESIWDSPNPSFRDMDSPVEKEDLKEKYFQIIDQELEESIGREPASLFVLGAESVLRLFKTQSMFRHSMAVSVPGNYISLSIQELKRLVRPYVHQIALSYQQDVVKAISTSHTISGVHGGIDEVMKAAYAHKRSLLLIEEDFRIAALNTESYSDQFVQINQRDIALRKTNAVDGMIMEVLKRGGKVDIVPKGLLKKFGHIVLVQDSV